jgi:DHA1 family multidrug resistance protein-like MFS transporter/DHA1 family quinolone resistance protein-like MFS transporter
LSQVHSGIRSFYSGLGKTFIILPSSFMVATGISVIKLGIIFYIMEVFNATPSQIGFFTALWSFSYIIGCIFVRPLFKNILPRFLMIGSSILMCLFVLLILFTKVFEVAFIYYALNGIAASFFWPPIIGWFSQDIEGAKLGKTMSYFNFSWNAGLILGPFLAGVLSAVNSELPIYIGGLLYFITGILVASASLMLPKIKLDRGSITSEDEQTAKIDSSTILRFPAWIGLFTTFGLSGVVMNIFPVFAVEELLLRKEIIGVLMQSRNYIAVVVFILLGHSVFWHFKISIILTCQVVLAGLLFSMKFISSPFVFAVSIALIGGIRAFSYSSSLFHGISGSINRSGRIAVHEVLLNSGLIFGSSMGGLIYQNFSMNTVFYFCSSIAMIGALLQAGLYFLLKGKDGKLSNPRQFA